jgi:hypothetical protein
MCFPIYITSQSRRTNRKTEESNGDEPMQGEGMEVERRKKLG